MKDDAHYEDGATITTIITTTIIIIVIVFITMLVPITTLSPLSEKDKHCCTSAGHDGCPAMAVSGHGNSGLRTGLRKGPLVSGFGLRSQGPEADRAGSFFNWAIRLLRRGILRSCFQLSLFGRSRSASCEHPGDDTDVGLPGTAHASPSRSRASPALLSIPSAGSVTSSLVCMLHLIPALTRPALGSFPLRRPKAP